MRGPLPKVTLPVTYIDRRTLLRSGLAATTLGALGAATGCTTAASPAKPGTAAGGPHLIGPDSPQVAAAEAARHKTGSVVPVALAATAGPVDLGGVVVNTWSYHGQMPGPEIRVRKGDVVQATLGNQLPAQTTVHWHGIAIRNNMDGVPDDDAGTGPSRRRPSPTGSPQLIREPTGTTRMPGSSSTGGCTGR